MQERKKTKLIKLNDFEKKNQFQTFLCCFIQIEILIVFDLICVSKIEKFFSYCTLNLSPKKQNAVENESIIIQLDHPFECK